MVMDFGLAKERRAGSELAKLTATGIVLGTPEFMSPEQIRGKPLDGRSDVYALGVLAFELFTGQLPFPGKSAQETMIARLRGQPMKLRDVKPDFPPKVEAVIRRALVDGRRRRASARWPRWRWRSRRPTRPTCWGGSSGADKRASAPRPGRLTALRRRRSSRARAGRARSSPCSRSTRGRRSAARTTRQYLSRTVNSTAGTMRRAGSGSASLEVPGPDGPPRAPPPESPRSRRAPISATSIPRNQLQLLVIATSQPRPAVQVSVPTRPSFQRWR